MTNKYQEALEFITDHTKADCKTIKDLEGLEFAYDILQELVDKETPMKPLRVNEEWDTIFGEVVHESECPKCNCMLLGRGTRCFYEDCGQRIDWGDEE